MTTNINTNIEEIREIIQPTLLLEKYKLSEDDINFINESRISIENILHNKDDRLIAIVGPCSVHSYDLAIDYAKELQKIQQQMKNTFIIIRIYFEKPRTRTVNSWVGFSSDPDLNFTYNINKGIDLSRKLLLEITKMKIPIATEFLDPISPQYFSDLISYGCLGARTVESQPHRQLISGISPPCGLKNLTSGNYTKAIDAILSARHPQNFLGINENGYASHIITKGNKNCNIILRGGEKGTNYQQDIIEKVSNSLKKENINTGIIIDCSHGNSCKEYNRQIAVALFVKRLRMLNKYPIRGLMLESHINKGNQSMNTNLEYGISITDACIDINTTKYLLHILDNTKKHEPKILDDIRKIISYHDELIYNALNNQIDISEILIDNVITEYLFEEDKEVADICKNRFNEELLIMMITNRLALSEKVAEIKLKTTPFQFINKNNDLLKLVTYRNVEKQIINKYPDSIFLKIMEISKNIQVKFLETVLPTIKIGYLFGRGTFSSEIIKNFHGTFYEYSDYNSLKFDLSIGKIEFMIIPTYNGIIGEIFKTEINHKVQGAIDHEIKLSLFSNKNIKKDKKYNANILYVEEHVYQEAKQYIDKNIIVDEIIFTESSFTGLLESLKNDNKICITFSSINNDSNFLYKIDDDIVKHNITTFSLISL